MNFLSENKFAPKCQTSKKCVPVHRSINNTSTAIGKLKMAESSLTQGNNPAFCMQHAITAKVGGTKKRIQQLLCI